MTHYPEPPIPSGCKASEWLSWHQIQVVASMLEVNKDYSVGENFAVNAQLKKKIARGEVQRWKQGPHQQSPVFYRSISKVAIPMTLAQELNRKLDI